MQKAENILEAVRKLGEKQVPLTRVYRSLFSEDLFLTAYAKIYKNDGALTPGPEADTADGMSITRIRHIIGQLRYERYRFRPVRRVYIDKKSGGKRPLGMPNFSDKLVQEALRLMLEAYYEPRFRDSSHGFRPGRGCHTALEHVKVAFKGTAWFIEGDITGCFDNIDHDILMDILRRDVQDGRLLNLIQQCLKAGSLEDWKYLPSFSGVPQGGILSPLLSNIYLHELDTFIEETLIPQYTKGIRRAENPDYVRLTRQIHQARKAGNKARVHELEQQRRSLPSQDVQDPDYRRLKYVRYADDFLLGFIGSKSEAESIKVAIGEFLRNKLHLQASDEKTLITHARTQHAQFLGYAISTYMADGKLTRSSHDNAKRRSANGAIRLGIPYGLIDKTAKRYLYDGKPVHESVLINNSDAHIIMEYQSRFRGLAEYYKYAVDRHKLSKLSHVMEVALAKTLARKHKTSVSKIYRRYRGTRTVDGRRYKTLQVEVETKEGTTTIYWGAVPLRTVRAGNEPLEDTRHREQWRYKRSDLIQRLQADTCELCGSQMDVQVHHVRKLSDLKKRWAGRITKPAWVKHMIAMRRKTLMVCHRCHVNIHSGKPVSQTRI